MEKEKNKMEESVRFVARHYRKGAFDTAQGWKRLTATLPGFGRTRRITLTTRVAAAVALLVVATGVLVMRNRPEELTAQADHTGFTLPDRTEIVMRKGAKLKYDKHFDKTERRVSMQGEITFSVARDEARPFIVAMPTARIEVLGTEFTVAADDEGARLSVASGKVRFTPGDPVVPLICNAGMTVRYNAADKTLRVTSPGGGMEINAKERSLTFNNMELEEIVMVLSHFYKVEIHLPASESGLAFSSSFTRESVIEIINIINLTLDTHITIIE